MALPIFVAYWVAFTNCCAGSYILKSTYCTFSLPCVDRILSLFLLGPEQLHHHSLQIMAASGDGFFSRMFCKEVITSVLYWPSPTISMQFFHHCVALIWYQSLWFLFKGKEELLSSPSSPLPPPKKEETCQ